MVSNGEMWVFDWNLFSTDVVYVCWLVANRRKHLGLNKASSERKNFHKRNMLD